MTVKDDAHVFDKDSVIRAESKFHGVTFKSPTHFTVQTFDKVPDDKKADFEKVKNDPTAKHAFMRDWVRELAPVESERGVFVLICQEARALEVVTDRQTDLKRHFGDDNAKALAAIFTDGMKKATDAKTDVEKQKVRGDALVKGTDYVVAQLKNTSAPEATGGTHSDGGIHEAKKSGGMHWIWWVVIVIGVLLVIWIIVALIRAMTGNVYGGMYGGYGGGYGGGGGPGFFGMFMGGMLGSMAGMWLYNSMMGTHYAHDPSMAAGDTGGDAGATDTGAGDYDNGAEAGGDWGDDGGGGDAGAGGDWGGDAGGGGDWGGDGGGGDWGGGGGDFGGGGGDW
jgi:uncharacterized protein